MDDLNERQEVIRVSAAVRQAVAGAGHLREAGRSVHDENGLEGTTSTAHRQPVSAKELRKHTRSCYRSCHWLELRRLRSMPAVMCRNLYLGSCGTSGPSRAGTSIHQQVIRKTEEHLHMPRLGMQRGAAQRGERRGGSGRGDGCVQLHFALSWGGWEAETQCRAASRIARAWSSMSEIVLLRVRSLQTGSGPDCVTHRFRPDRIDYHLQTVSYTIILLLHQASRSPS